MYCCFTVTSSLLFSPLKFCGKFCGLHEMHYLPKILRLPPSHSCNIITSLLTICRTKVLYPQQLTRERKNSYLFCQLQVLFTDVNYTKMHYRILVFIRVTRWWRKVHTYSCDHICIKNLIICHINKFLWVAFLSFLFVLTNQYVF